MLHFQWNPVYFLIALINVNYKLGICNHKGHVKQSNNPNQPISKAMSEGKEEKIVPAAGCVVPEDINSGRH